MEDLTCTPVYSALLERRRADLSAQLAVIVPGGGPFVWEVGAGHGHFLTAYAQAHPAKICIGIDLVGERVERAARKRDRARLPNLHFLRAEAGFFLQTLPPGATLSEIFILFPDPWPKLRHRKHRLVQPRFLDAIAARAGKSCPLYFRTDFRPYFDEAAAAIHAHPLWRLVDERWPFEFETVFQSRSPSHHSLIARRS